MSSLCTNDKSGVPGAWTATRLRPRQRRSAGLAAALGVTGLTLIGCHGAGPAAAPPAVVVALPVHPAGDEAMARLRYPVEAAARYTTVLSFRVDGKIIERYVRLGDAVHKGQRLAELDPKDAEAKARADHAALEAAEHRLLFAKQALDRDTAQFAQHLIAESALEQTQDAYAAAVAGGTEAADQYGVSRDNLGYQTLIADHDGVITGENADTGQNVSRGQPVFGLAWGGDLDALLDAAAGDVGGIAAGQTAEVIFPALPGRRFHAVVREVSPAADAQSRTYRVKLTLVNPAPAVRLGMTGEATFAPAAAVAEVPPVGAASTGSPAAAAAHAGSAPPALFKIPAAAIFHRGNQPAVWIIRPMDSTLELRPVTVRSFLDGAAIISGGIADGERLVLAGVHTVFAGERVTAVEPLFSDHEHE